MTEDEMVGWHHQLLDGHEFEQAPVMDRAAWPATVRDVAKSRTQQSDGMELS